MKKRSINPDIAKFISSSLVAIIFAAIVITATHISFKKTLIKAETQFYDNLYSTLDGYTQTTNRIMKNYISSLEAFYIPEFTESATDEEIFDFLVKYDIKRNPDFLSIYYISLSGIGYFSNGNKIPMKSENHPILFNSDKLHVSPVLYTEHSKRYVFAIEKPVFDTEGNKKGVLCASVCTDSLAQQLGEIKIGNNSELIILDNKGQFVYNTDNTRIGSVYIPKEKEYEQFSTPNLVVSDNKLITSESSQGNKVDIILDKLPQYNWTVGIVLPHSVLEAIFTEQKEMKIFVTFCCLLLIFVLVLLEMRIMNYFQKNQFFPAHYDSLTNLWTRQHFEDEATKQLRTNPKTKFMLIEADIRGFKFINETYGEEAADKILMYYADTVKHFSDKFHGIIGRGFADRFYVLIKVSSVHKAMALFKENMVECQKIIDDSEIPFFAKFGIAFLLPDNKKRDITIQGLIGQASFAKSTIKDDALTPYSVYNSRLLDKINEEHFIETHMQQALDDGEFFVMYQPKISLKDEKICGAEALVRWNSPVQGFMTPDKFIPLFERNGFIKKLDFFVYEEVFKLLERQLASGEPVVPISVNMSRNHNKAEKFIHDFLELFNKYNVPPEYIQLEIIERSFMGSNTLSEITTRLHKEGFTVAMDDFGSGESSLNMLTTIPVDVLKFDRAFLLSSMNDDGTMNKKSAEFIHILINLSKNLEKQSVFEGVETKEQCDFLKSINCDMIQGYFYSRPLSEKDFLEFIKMHI